MSASDATSLTQAIAALARPLVEAMGLVLWGIEIVDAGHRTVRVYIDSRRTGEESEVNADLDRCEELSRHLGLALDVENVFENSWVLEVSTPGLSRPFFSLEQLGGYVGDVVEARMQAPFPQGPSGRRTWKGVVQDVQTDSFTLQPAQITEDDTLVLLPLDPVVLPWKEIRKIHRIALFPRPVKPGKAGKKIGKTKTD